jgi:hypothetical protein
MLEQPAGSQAVAAIKLVKQKGFQVYTNTTVFNTDTPQDLIDTPATCSTTAMPRPGRS